MAYITLRDHGAGLAVAHAASATSAVIHESVQLRVVNTAYAEAFHANMVTWQAAAASPVDAIALRLFFHVADALAITR